jgi:hypothetical protein
MMIDELHKDLSDLDKKQKIQEIKNSIEIEKNKVKTGAL